MFSGVHSDINSLKSNEYKHGLIFTVLSWIFLTVLDFFKFHQEVNYLSDVLTLFRMGGQKGPPTSFSPVNSTNVGISPQNLLTFSFNPFAILV